MAVHESFRLHVTGEKFLVEPLDTDSGELLSIDRVSHDISLLKNDVALPPAEETKIIYGIIGVIRLIAGPYLLVITKRSKVGEVNGQSIWKVTGTQVYSYSRSTTHLNEQQLADNARYLSMVEHLLGYDSFYFSSTYDVTHTMQRLHNTSPDFLHMPLHERADARFVWNSHLLRELSQQQELSRFCTPIMLGFITIKTAAVNAKQFNYALISRRSAYRAGCRYYRRGADQEGHVANFVETEQIIEYEGTKCSFVQTRGSVPLIWSQYPDLTYKPTPNIQKSQTVRDAFQSHFATQCYTYGQNVIVNLLDNKGKEIELQQQYTTTIQQLGLPSVRYEPFDFHHECRKMRWDRLSILIDRISDEMDRFGYFQATNGHVVTTQDGVYRTNCIDCLDRTNVVQNMLARRTLQNQLLHLGILGPGQRIEEQVGFEHIIKNVWADNADALAVQYAGTGALKTDFTRTGRRTKLGMLRDGWNSGVRYLMNNFYDGFRQDSMDLFLGNYVVEESEDITHPSPLRADRDWKFYALPAIFIVAFSMCLISILIPDEHPSEQLMYVLFWGGSSAASAASIYRFGLEFVDKPKLSPTPHAKTE